MARCTQPPAPVGVVGVEPGRDELAAGERPVVGHGGRPVTRPVRVSGALVTVTAAHPVTGKHSGPETAPVGSCVAPVGRGPTGPTGTGPAGCTTAPGRAGVRASGHGARAGSSVRHGYHHPVTGNGQSPHTGRCGGSAVGGAHRGTVSHWSGRMLLSTVIHRSSPASKPTHRTGSDGSSLRSSATVAVGSVTSAASPW